MRLDSLLPTVALVLVGAVVTAQVGVAVSQTVAQIETQTQVRERATTQFPEPRLPATHTGTWRGSWRHGFFH
jgi:hypothetical protein